MKHILNRFSILACIFALSVIAFDSIAQSVSATYTAGDISTDDENGYTGTCNGPISALTVSLPGGGPWTVTGVDIQYDMTANGATSAWISEQRSQVYCQNTTTDEGGFYIGIGDVAGTYSYNRLAVDIANGLYAGGTNLVFEMRGYASWTDGNTGCNTNYNKFDNNSWVITVHYTSTPNAITSVASQTNPSCFGDADGSVTVQSTGGYSQYAYCWSDANSGSILGVSERQTTLNTSITATGNNRLLVVAVATRGFDDRSAVAYGGQNLTFLTSENTATLRLEYFYLNEAGIAAAANSAVVVSPGAANVDGFYFHSTILENVDQDNPIGNIYTNTNTVNSDEIPLPAQDVKFKQYNLIAIANNTKVIVDSDDHGLVPWTELSDQDGNAPGLAGGGADDLGLSLQGWEVTSTQTNYSPGDGVVDFDNGNATEKVLIALNINPDGSSISGLSSGIYTVTINDANLTTSTFDVTITNPAPVAVTLTPTDYNGVEISCNGSSDGTIGTTVTGGTVALDYIYDWSVSTGSQTIPTATGLIAGTHSVIAEDDNGCTGSATVTLNEPTILTASPSVTSGYNGEDVSCNGAADGQVDASPGGGTPGYSYAWNAAALSSSNASVLGLPAGTGYVVTITDANGCTASDGVTITEPNALSITSTINSSVTCDGGNEGQITVVGSGGTGALTYSWSAGAGSQSTTSGIATALVAGIYSATVTDANSCQLGSSPSETITEPSTISVTIGTQTNVSCNAGNDGALDIDVSGGIGGYTYNWTGGATSQDISTLTQGTYTVTVTANTCTNTMSFTITEPTALVASLNTTVSETCFGDSDGSVDIDVTGGTTSYTYLWNDPLASTTQDIGGLTGNTFTVTVTDGLSCTTTLPVIVNGSPALLGLSTASVTTITCNGASTGAIDITTAAGTTPYTYTWDDGSATATEDISSLPVGTYSLTATDAFGCAVTISEAIAEDGGMAITTTVDNITDCSTADGNITVTASGGYGTTYSYLWNTADVTQSINVIAAGLYTVTVTDVSSTTITSDGETCASVYVSTVTSDAGITVTTSNTTVTCNGGSDGTATAISNPNTSSTYIWSANAGSQTTAVATGLIAGNYLVTVSDNNCNEIRGITIIEPTQVSVTDVLTNPLCAGASNGSIDITAAGGIGAYTYSWSGTDAVVANEDQTGILSDGNYDLTVTDGNLCFVTATYNLSAPAGVGLSTVLTTSVSCNGSSTGVVTATPSGGSTPYSYVWDVGAGAQSASSGVATALPSGIYSVTLTDANSCFVTASETVTEPATAISGTPSISNAISCNGGVDGEITIAPAGGTGSYSFVWSANAGVQSATSGVATALSANTYGITITDANLCSVTTSLAVSEPASITVNPTTNLINGADVSCAGATDGSVTLAPAGGTTGYTYAWPTTPPQSTITGTGLFAGPTFKVTVSDGNGCDKIENIVLTNPPLLTLSTAITSNFNGEDISCVGSSDGTGSAILTGGTLGGGYGYNWDTSPAQNTSASTGLFTGTHNVTATDGNGCVATGNVIISAPTLLSLSASTSITYNGVNVSCLGASDGGIQTTLTSAGTVGAGYTYLWSSGHTTNNIAGVPAGPYAVTITDGNGCDAVSDLTLTEPSGITATASTTSSYGAGGYETNCSYSSDGSGTVVPSGGTIGSGYTYAWDNAETTASTSASLSPGAHNVTVTDGNGCFQVETITITPAPAIVSGATQTNVAVAGSSTGQASVAPTGGQSGYTYLWTNVSGVITGANQANSGITNMPAGTYNMTITDANSCALPVTFVITENASLDGGTITHVDASGAILNVCENDVAVTNIMEAAPPSGGDGVYAFAWEFSTDFINWAPIVPTVTVSDYTNTFNVTATQIIRRVVTDGASAVAYSNSMILLSVDTTTTLSFIPNSFCDNNAQPENLLVSPSNGSSVWVFNDLVSPANTTLTTNGDGTTDFVASGYPAGNHEFTHVYTNGNGCVSTLVTSVTINPFTPVNFDYPPAVYTLGSSPVVLNDHVNVIGGTFSGPGVVFVDVATGYTFDPSLTGEDTLIYTYTDGNGCVDIDDDIVNVVTSAAQMTVDAVVVANAGEGFYCMDVASYVIEVDTGINGMSLLNPNATPSSSVPDQCFEIVVEITTGPVYANEIYWTITDALSNVILSVPAGTYPANNTTYIDTFAVTSSSLTFNAYDSYGDGWNNGTYTLTSGCDGALIANNGGATPNNGTPGANNLESTESFSMGTASWTIIEVSSGDTLNAAALGTIANMETQITLNTSNIPDGGNDYNLIYTYLSASDSSTVLSSSYIMKFSDNVNVDFWEGDSLQASDFVYCVGADQRIYEAHYSFSPFDKIILGTYSDTSSWGNLDPATAGAPNGQVIYTPDSVGIESVLFNHTLTDGSNCAISVSNEITIYDLPQLSLIIAQSADSNFCLYESDTIYPNIPNGVFTASSNNYITQIEDKDIWLFDIMGPNSTSDSTNQAIPTNTPNYSNSLCVDGYFGTFLGDTNTFRSKQFNMSYPLGTFTSGDISLFYTDCGLGDATFEIYLNDSLISIDTSLGNSCSCTPNATAVPSYPHTINIPGNILDSAWNVSGSALSNTLTVIINAGSSGTLYFSGATMHLNAGASNGTFGVFNAANTTPGINPVKYEFTDANQCYNSVTANLIVYNQPSTSLAIDPLYNVLNSGDSIFLAIPDTAILSTYSYSGPAITNGLSYMIDPTITGPGQSINDTIITGFVPSIAGIGAHSIYFNYTDDNGCSFTDSAFTVVQEASGTFTAIDSNYCEGGPWQGISASVNNSNGADGNFYGRGVNDPASTPLWGQFSPTIAGVGADTIYFTYFGTDGVTEFTIDTIINVSPLPAINFSVDTLLNITQGAYSLPPTATPYSSNQDTSYFTFNIGGVSTESNTFFPANAGIGNTTITYTYTDALGCTNTAMDAIEIDTARGSFYNLPLNNFYCNNDPLDTIWAIPINGDGSIGIYSEPSGNLTNIASSDSAQFNPALFTPGQYTISYTYMGWDGNTPFTIDTIINFTANPAISFDMDTLFNITEGPYYLPAVSTIVDLGSVASQVYSSSGNGVTGNFFYPDSAGLGNFDVSYIVTDTIGCVSTIIDSTVVQEASGIFGGLPSNNNYCIDTPIDSIWVSGVLNGNPQPCNQIDIEITTGPFYANEIYWTITDNLGVVVDSALANSYPLSNTIYSATYNIGSGTGFNFNAYDSYGDGWNGGTYIITSTCFGTVLATNGGATPNNGTPGANTIESTEIFNNDAVYTGSFSGNGVSNTTVPDTAIVNPSANSPGLLTISYQYFGFDSTTLFTIDTTVNIAPLPILTFDMDTLFNVVEPPYSLVNSWTSANIGASDTSYFSGVGITDSSFYPDSAGVGDFIISFTYIDDTGCTATITDHTIVQSATANWFGIPNNNFYCSDGTVDIIWATSTEIDPTKVGWYTSSISSNPALFDIDGQFITDSANYSPADLSFISADSIIIDTVTYHYFGFDGTTEFTVDTAIFTVNLGLANITGFAPTYCIDAENDTLFGSPSFNAGGGIFSSISIGLNNLGDTAIFNPNAAGAGLHDIQYQYTDTSSSCYVDGNIQVEVFALPNLAINLPAIGNDLPSGEYCMSVDTVNITGQVNGLLASIGDYWGNGVSNFIVNDGEAYFHPDSVGIQGTLVVADTIWYSYTDPITNCFSTAFKEVLVRSLPNPYIDGLDGQDPNAIVSGYYCQNFGDIFMNYGNNVLGGGFQSVDWLVNGLASSNQINTNNLPDTVIPIQLTYTDNYGCINIANDTIVINPHPIGSFSVEDQCITTPINFTDLSSIDNSLGDSISSWQWNFGVLGANDSVQNPSYLYEATNPVQINLSVTSNNGCGASFDSVLINLGTKPPSDFSWRNECYEDTVLFSVADITSSFPGIIIYKWDFGDGVLTDTTLANTMSHEYNNVQPYNVQLIVNTSSGCTDTTVKTLNVRPFYTPTLSNPYTADFESGKDGWLAESIGLSSWEFGTPNNSLLNSAYSGDSAWVTGIDTNYYDAENSWIASPCYDLSLLERPMVKVWINSAMQENDGAVLQSTINSGESWQNVGAVNTGINWFNLNGLEGSPGEQSITQGNVGWSDTTSSWTEGRHSLDNLLAETKVRFRIAFGSNTSDSSSAEGIAFDDIWIGDRERLVLLEHFTNLGISPNISVNTIVNSNPKDVVDIQYHTSFPTDDQFNTDNPADPSSRVLYYGVTQVTYSHMDGNQYSGNNWTQNDLDFRILQDPQFDIELSSTIIGSVIKINSTITSRNDLDSSDITLHVAITESNINLGGSNYSSVLKALLPDGAGVRYEKAWLAGESVTAYNSYDLTNLYDEQLFEVIAFVQNNTSKEVYQVAFNDSAQLSSSVIVEQIVDKLNYDFALFPNPTSNNATLLLGDEIVGDVQVVILNQMGQVVSTGILSDGTTKAQIDLSSQSSGVYFVQINSQGHNLGVKKLIVNK